MTETISNLFRMRERFLRSTHLERDFDDPAAINGYVLTPQTKGYLSRMYSGLDENSGQRAWRITGDFGTGKSSFALIAAHLFGDTFSALPKRMQSAIRFGADVRTGLPRLFPVLVTGAREPLATALLRSLHRSLLDTCKRGRIASAVSDIEFELKARSGRIPEDRVISLLTEASTYVVAAKKGTGILIVLDELGKFLEFASLHPDRDDVYLLQRLAETASRSGKAPILVLGLLHQGFNAYADRLSQSAQKEWEKVASRFEELVFDRPLEQTASLVADALNIRTGSLPESVSRKARADMAELLKCGWYGHGAGHDLIDNAPRVYPLHPSVLPVLVKLFSRFGQNERSLFSFLISNEPHGLQEFARRSVAGRDFYRIHNLYDYAHAAFGHRLGIQSYRSHWNQITSLINSFSPTENLELETLKTVGLLNMLDTSNLVASEPVIRISTDNRRDKQPNSFRVVLEKLQKKDRVLYFRGQAGGYCLWPHTSVNLERAYEDASRALGGTLDRVAPHLQKYLETRPIVARRHYIETGNLRHFEVVYSPVHELSNHTELDYASVDGRILIALCESEEERLRALEFADSDLLKKEPGVLLAVPKPLGVLGNLVQESQRWEWISSHVPELNNDNFATEEVARQITASRRLLEQRVQAYIGLKESGGSELKWFHHGEALSIVGSRDLLSYLSLVLDEVYHLAPVVSNELINRRSLSSAAAAARMRLMEGAFRSRTKPFLGIDATKKPPEMSIYLSLFKEGGIHKEADGQLTLSLPAVRSDPCRLRPILRFIQKLLVSQRDHRIKISEVFGAMRRPPYGVRDGLSPLLLAIFASIHEQNVAFYDNGSFMREVTSLDLMRLVKVPEDFELQYFDLKGVRSEVFHKLFHVLNLVSPRAVEADLLDVVRPLCVFAAELPAYSQKTSNLTERAQEVRKILLTAKDPSRLLFQDLPIACGYRAFSNSKAVERKEIQKFAEALKESLAELKGAYLELQDRMKTTLIESFDLNGAFKSFQELRTSLASRAGVLGICLTEPRVKAFCHRLADLQLAETQWLESLGSLVCSMPPNRWTDVDESKFRSELFALTAKFQRLESFTYSVDSAASKDGAIRIAVTKIDGSEKNRVIRVSPTEEKRIKSIEAKIASILKENQRLGMAAAARAVWTALGIEGEKKNG